MPLYFKDYGDTKKIIKFSLPEATLQIASSIFTVKFFNLTQFTDEQEDIFFILFNANNDYLTA